MVDPDLIRVYRQAAPLTDGSNHCYQHISRASKIAYCLDKNSVPKEHPLRFYPVTKEEAEEFARQGFAKICGLPLFIMDEDYEEGV